MSETFDLPNDYKFEHIQASSAVSLSSLKILALLQRQIPPNFCSTHTKAHVHEHTNTHTHEIMNNKDVRCKTAENRNVDNVEA